MKNVNAMDDITYLKYGVDPGTPEKALQHSTTPF